jgi:hypothetical protein
LADIKGLESLNRKLQARAAQAVKDSDVEVVVGYTAAYALYVHEDVEMKLAGKSRPSGRGVYWGPSGQAKFLEQPAREKRDRIAEIVRTAFRQKKTVAQSLLLGGYFLQRESQKLVPVEFGVLKNSAFTRLEGASARRQEGNQAGNE